ncbi:MAG: hypothetical protein KC422_11210 [Trueperaceae bacterium]|nr:hypothetical protein [Trueperaceae bacterium]
MPKRSFSNIRNLQRKCDIVETDLGNELVLLDPESQVLYLLDELGMYVWRHLPELGLHETLDLIIEKLRLTKAEALRGIDSYVLDLLMSGFFYQPSAARLPSYLHASYDVSKN